MFFFPSSCPPSSHCSLLLAPCSLPLPTDCTTFDVHYPTTLKYVFCLFFFLCFLIISISLLFSLFESVFLSISLCLNLFECYAHDGNPLPIHVKVFTWWSMVGGWHLVSNFKCLCLCHLRATPLLHTPTTWNAYSYTCI